MRYVCSTSAPRVRSSVLAPAEPLGPTPCCTAPQDKEDTIRANAQKALSQCGRTVPRRPHVVIGVITHWSCLVDVLNKHDTFTCYMIPQRHTDVGRCLASVSTDARDFANVGVSTHWSFVTIANVMSQKGYGLKLLIRTNIWLISTILCLVCTCMVVSLILSIATGRRFQSQRYKGRP